MSKNTAGRHARYGGTVIPEKDNPCIWMSAGVIAFRLCDSRFECDSCPFYRAMKGRDETSTEQVGVKGFRLLSGLFYHPGHTWAKIEEGGSMRVGLDDFGQALIGRVQDVQLPAKGEKVSGGSIRVRGRDVNIALHSPADGTVTDVNEAVLDDPSFLNMHPYGGGWLFVVRPIHLSRSLKGLFYGSGAERWYGREIERLQGLMAQAVGKAPGGAGVGQTLQDGGSPLLSLLDRMEKKKVRKILHQFFR